MIKSDAQRERTVAQIEGFRQALAKVEQGTAAKRSKAVRGSYEGMIRREDTIPDSDKDYLTDALQRLVQLYEALGRPEKSKEWQKKLAQLAPTRKN